MKKNVDFYLPKLANIILTFLYIVVVFRSFFLVENLYHLYIFVQSFL